MKYTLILLAALLAGCAHVDYQTVEVPGSAKIVDGKGGTKTVMDGYDIWSNGDPPRRYRVLGIVTIERHDNFFGDEFMKVAIVDSIKTANGDAAIADSLPGTISNGAGFRKRSSRFQVIKYQD